MKAQALLLAIVFTLSAVPANAVAAEISAQDKKWLRNTYQICLTAISASKAALDHGEAVIVDKVAKKIIEDDKMLKMKIMKVADALGVSLPHSPSPKMQSMLQTIGSTSGDFDKVWTQEMLNLEIKAANKTQEEIAEGTSQRVVKLAKLTLPVVLTEINMLQHAKAKLE